MPPVMVGCKLSRTGLSRVYNLSETSKDSNADVKKSFMAQHAAGYALGLKFLFILMCPIVASLACGLGLDRWLGTIPWLMLIFVIIGLVFAIYAVYRVAVNLQEEMN